MPSSRMGLNLQLGRQAPIPQNGLCFHPKNTANTHTSDPETSCVDLGSPEGLQNSVLKESGRVLLLRDV